MQTICNNANCPNRGECWSKGTATVLILGNVCTRHCGFCSVAAGKPAPPDPTEPARLAQMAKQMNLKYLVITSVNRDDLPDGGAGHFRNCINIVRQQCPDMKFEILTPDFCNCQTQALKILREALPFVFAHNVETVPSLYPLARTGGNYHRSLNLLKMAKEYLRTMSRPNPPLCSAWEKQITRSKESSRTYAMSAATGLQSANTSNPQKIPLMLSNTSPLPSSIGGSRKHSGWDFPGLSLHPLPAAHTSPNKTPRYSRNSLLIFVLIGHQKQSRQIGILHIRRAFLIL